MAEPKRLSFTTVTQAKETKPKKKDSKTVRLQLTLKPSTDTTCPEFFYTDLVKNELVGHFACKNHEINVYLIVLCNNNVKYTLFPILFCTFRNTLNMGNPSILIQILDFQHVL